MLSSSILGILLGTLLLITSVPDAASYTKYGRTCKDIGCRRDEVCVMAEDPCSIYQRDNCGRYPTCAKAHPGGASCASTICGENEYCKTENDAPTCVKKSTAVGYDSAGVSYVNGQRTNNDENHDKTSNSASNSNPYANANAPPAPADPAGGYHQVNSGSNLGYPAYPSNSASNSGSNSGYPPYPSSNQGNRQQDLGYPPYPTHNRMPVPGQAYPARQPSQSNYPIYPGQPAYPAPPGYPQQYPGYQNYPYANYPNANYPNANYPNANYPNQNRMYHNNVHSGYRRNNAIMQSPSLMIIYSASLIMVLVNRLS